MSHKTTLSTRDLCIGMFVSDLDRSWLETPFLMEGVLIENEDQIATFQRCCQTVTVDRSRSHGDCFANREYGRDRLLASALTSFSSLEEVRPQDFSSVCQIVRTEPELPRFQIAPIVAEQDTQSALEQEMLYSAPLIDDVKDTLQAIRESLEISRDLPLKDVAPKVSEMARAVERNPDAMLWLARLRIADKYSYDHAVDVSVHLMVFARFLGMPTQLMEQMGLAGLLQDVGKIDIPPEVLNKPESLSEDEYHLVQSHVASSLEIVYGAEGMTPQVLDIIASHHERLDGSGYPRRLKGERISFLGELAGLVDTYCAMTRDRVYDHAVSSQKALESLIKMRGSKFRDPVVDQFVQCIGLYPIGSLVELNTGEVGVVIQQNHVRRLKPRLLIILAPDKTYERRPLTLDLMMDPVSPTGQLVRIVQALPVNAYGINPAEFYLG